MTFKRPILKKGDTVGVISPASSISDVQFEKILENMEKLKLKPFYYESLFEKKAYLAGNDQDRIDELHKMYLNSEIKAVITARGGYGTARLIDKVDYEIIKNNPKPLIGFSDITALLCAIYKKTGQVNFHGVVGSSKFNKYTTEQFLNVFFKNENKIRSKEIENQVVINKGKAIGKLIGGNLSILNSLIGTPFDLNWDNCVIFIEEVGEPLYRIDRMLTQLISSGKLNKVKGLVLGSFRHCSDGETADFKLINLIKEKFEPMKIPCVYNFSFGHIHDQAIFPVGADCEFDADNFVINLI